MAMSYSNRDKWFWGIMIVVGLFGYFALGIDYFDLSWVERLGLAAFGGVLSLCMISLPLYQDALQKQKEVTDQLYEKLADLNHEMMMLRVSVASMEIDVSRLSKNLTGYSSEDDV